MGDEKNQVILALGGGAARGLAHIGVLRGLEEDGIPVAGIAGTSMGAIVGALHAQGLGADEIEGLFDEVDWQTLGRIMVRSVIGTAFHDLLRETLGTGLIQELGVPFAAVCCDLDTGDRVVLCSGSIADAVRASSAIPGILTPLRVGGRTLVDGAIVEPVPVTVARTLGDGRVLPVNVLRPPKPDEDITTVHSLPRLGNRGSDLVARLHRWLRRQPDHDRRLDGDLPSRWEAVVRSFHMMQYQLALAVCEPVDMV
jgi:NTE family protein